VTSPYSYEVIKFYNWFHGISNLRYKLAQKVMVNYAVKRFFQLYLELHPLWHWHVCSKNSFIYPWKATPGHIGAADKPWSKGSPSPQNHQNSPSERGLPSSGARNLGAPGRNREGAFNRSRDLGYLKNHSKFETCMYRIIWILHI